MENTFKNNRIDNMDKFISVNQILESKAQSSKEQAKDMLPMQTFNNTEFGSVRIVEKDGQPWFVAKDVCDCLGLANPTRAISRIDKDEGALLQVTHPQSPTKSIEVNCVNEYGLYTLILASRKPEAKQFKKWITHEVIPSIRKYGGYVAGQENMTPEQFLSKALLYADSKMKDMQAKIEEMQPKAIFADAVSESKGSIQIASLAKLLCQNGIDIGRNRLFEWLRDNNYLCSHGDNRNLPTQSAMDLGLFRVKEVHYIDEFGIGRIGLTTMVTPKGQGYFINKFLCEKYS